MSQTNPRRSRSGAIAGLALAVLALSPAATLASPAGDPDASFDKDGRRLLTTMKAANRVIAQPDGKTLVVGDGNDGAFHVERLNGDGSRDRAFGTDGVATIDFGGDDRALAAALQPDGKIVVAGDSITQTGRRPSVARLTAGGSLDPTFDPGGADGDGKKILIGTPIGTDLKTVLIQPDGKLVLAGRGYSNGNIDMALVRLNRNGAPDGTTFARGNFGTQTDAEGAALLADGRIAVAGTRYLPSGGSEIAIARFNADDGSLDTTLGGTGKVTLPSGESEMAQAVLAQPDGKLVVAGGTSGNDQEMLVVRINPDGSPDRSFSGDGRASTGFDGISLARAAALAPDGKILVAGAVVPPYDFAVARLDTGGALDGGYGSGGRTTVGFGLKTVASAIAVRGDGRAVVAGVAEGGVVSPVARLLADPPPIPQPDSGGDPSTGGDTGSGGDGGSRGGASDDRTAPVVGRVRLSPKAFSVSSRTTALNAAARGTTIRYTLSETAAVIVRIERRATRRNAGALRRTGRAGGNRIAFSGRIGRKRLRPGSYRIKITATDAAGNRSAARTGRFRILR